MDGLNLYITVTAVALGIGSAFLNLKGSSKYKDNAVFWEQTADGYRRENTALRDDKTTLTNQLIAAQTAVESKDETISTLIPFSDLAKIMSNNHKEVLQTMSDNFSKVTAIITEKTNG